MPSLLPRSGSWYHHQQEQWNHEDQHPCPEQRASSSSFRAIPPTNKHNISSYLSSSLSPWYGIRGLFLINGSSLAPRPEFRRNEFTSWHNYSLSSFLKLSPLSLTHFLSPTLVGPARGTGEAWDGVALSPVEIYRKHITNFLLHAKWICSK